jgi:phage-related protein
MAEIFTGVPDISSKRSQAPRMKRLMLGNGYAQKYGDGINSNPETWDIVLSAKSEAEKQYYENFFSDNCLTYFLWTSPESGSTQKAYECVSWDTVALGNGNYTISAVFNQWFGLFTLGETEMLDSLEMESSLEML